MNILERILGLACQALSSDPQAREYAQDPTNQNFIGVDPAQSGYSADDSGTNKLFEGRSGISEGVQFNVPGSISTQPKEQPGFVRKFGASDLFRM